MSRRRGGPRLREAALSLALLGLVLLMGGAVVGEAQAAAKVPPNQPVSRTAVLFSAEEIAGLPTAGAGWEGVLRAAAQPTRHPDLSNQDDPTNVRVLAKALVAARTGDARLRAEVVRALVRVRGSERGANVLAVSRELLSYVLAADLIGLDGADRHAFEAWLRGIRSKRFHGRTLRSTHEDRPNNWGTHAGASRIAVAIYLGDDEEVERAAHVFKGWTGERGGWWGFDFGEATWQSTRFWRYAVNPVGATRDGHSIDGVLPDDQRRGGDFSWPPPKENYVYEALQGAVVQAALLSRRGYDAWDWGDRALLRAFRWLHEEADFPAEGDDTWLPWIVNRVYGADFPAKTPSQPGKGMGFADWLYGDAGGERAPAP